jgi:hypothetical protein
MDVPGEDIDDLMPDTPTLQDLREGEGDLEDENTASGMDNPVLLYLQEAGTVPLLKPEDEVRIAKQIATLKARVFPRWTGWLQIAAVPVALIGSMLMEAFLSERLWNTWPAGISPLAFGYYMAFTGYAGAGYRLWSEGRISPTVTENESRATEPKASVQIS